MRNRYMLVTPTHVYLHKRGTILEIDVALLRAIEVEQNAIQFRVKVPHGEACVSFFADLPPDALKLACEWIRYAVSSFPNSAYNAATQ